ncbi:MAG TPA: BLUF domain-containing protein [Bacteroidales bacterium]|nr:BLUF domain-containing protein [Bacteroidales bacterium]
MKDLIHIVYVSFSGKDLSEADLEELLKEVRSKNEKQQVTGLLLYNDGSFIQVIEGRQQTIRELYDRISGDHRHTNVVKLLEEPIKKRAFPDWSMGFRRITSEQSSAIPGFSNFMHEQNPVKTVQESTRQVVYLLNSFRKYT